MSALRAPAPVRRQAADASPRAHGPPGDGAQVLRRAASILKTIAAATPLGLTLAEVSRAQALPKSTVHRILRCLNEEGLVERPAGSLRYHTGQLAYELGLSVTRSTLDLSRWRRAVDAVAERTGVTTYLMRRSGLEAVCLMKAEGRAVVRVIPVEVGQRRLLGVGAGATALLAAVDEPNAEQMLKLIVPALKDYPRITEASLREAVGEARREGVAISRGKVMPYSFGMGMAIAQAPGEPLLAISIAAHLNSVSDADVAQWRRVLREEIAQALTRQRQGVV